MNIMRRQGSVAIALGFVLTVIAGLILAFLANDTLDTFQLLISAGIVFVLVAPIFGFGIYRYASSAQAEAHLVADEMEKPRQLLDILKANGQADLETLSRELGSSADEIKAMIDDLISLELFSGIINWDEGIIALIDPNVLKLIDTCKNCHNPISMKESGVTICPHCGTQYYQI